MFLSKITELNCWGISIRQFIAGFCSWNFGPSVMGSVSGKVFSVMGPNNYQINSLGIFSGNDPVKNCRKSFTENVFRSVVLVMTMAIPWQLLFWQRCLLPALLLLQDDGCPRACCPMQQYGRRGLGLRGPFPPAHWRGLLPRGGSYDNEQLLWPCSHPPQEVLQGVPFTGVPSCQVEKTHFQFLGPPTPRVSQWKNFGSGSVNSRPWRVEEFVWNFLRAFSLEIEGRKSAKKSAKISPQFSLVFWNWQAKNFTPNFALGGYSHNQLCCMKEMALRTAKVK